MKYNSGNGNLLKSFNFNNGDAAALAAGLVSAIMKFSVYSNFSLKIFNTFIT